VLCAAAANGKVHLIKGTQDNESYRIEPLAEGDYHEGGICLAVDWSATPDESLGCVSSHSNGDVCLWSAHEWNMELLRTWKAHSYEVWAVAGDSQTTLVYSGGDDCFFRSWDIRSDCNNPAHKIKYSMGVTCIRRCPRREHVIAVGSYDESISLWDLRSTKSPLMTTKVGGGVWRIKWNPFDPSLLLIACMHAGFVVLGENSSGFELLSKYTKVHSSLAYGVDWSHSRRFPRLAAACSFYDHLCSVWEPFPDARESN